MNFCNVSGQEYKMVGKSCDTISFFFCHNPDGKLKLFHDSVYFIKFKDITTPLVAGYKDSSWKYLFKNKKLVIKIDSNKNIILFNQKGQPYIQIDSSNYNLKTSLFNYLEESSSAKTIEKGVVSFEEGNILISLFYEDNGLEKQIKKISFVINNAILVVTYDSSDKRNNKYRFIRIQSYDDRKYIISMIPKKHIVLGLECPYNLLVNISVYFRHIYVSKTGLTNDLYPIYYYDKRGKLSNFFIDVNWCK